MPESLAQRADAFAFRFQAEAGATAGRAESGELVRGQRARAQPGFVAAAEQQRLQRRTRPSAHVERADAFGAAELVCAEAEERRTARYRINRNPAGALRGI